ncbi:tryptophan halogenase family protein [Catenovulum maritimum]|uniref:Tryptophan halogenase n=1 Tax=Catenovulum maritimum TaxID=1513271 RepID=A0A0J8GRL1_9ALTE|nr:tryptophan halogenase family protein [Catenovulum maritimum]KMT65460.1 tryptophan halogenase [Catenovulum maritimum]
MNHINKVVVVGGGTSGWMSAALLKKILGNTVNIELIESKTIGIIGVGEATIPPIQTVNEVLGINEAEFMRETKASIKLAIKFENWWQKGQSYFHTFGAPGQSLPFCHYHHLWTRAESLGLKTNLWDYDLNYLAATAGKFAKLETQDPMYEMKYAYHFDSALYGQFLRKHSEKSGVIRTEGLIENVNLNPATGNVESLTLTGGGTVTGDLFIDCSGMRGLLINQALGTGFEDWSHWLAADRAIAIPSERDTKTLPYTRSIAHSKGWQWNIPLQHRNGNGIVYSSRYCSDDEAQDTLIKNIKNKTLADPNLIKFKTGRTRKQWNKNVIAIGLSSGFLEPLESTSIYLVQSAIVRLLKFFPHKGIQASSVNEFNNQSQREYELIRDFIILHYCATSRTDSQFWRDMKALELPRRLTEKLDMFKENGTLVHDDLDVFWEPSWLQVMLGQGIKPMGYHPLASQYSQAKLTEIFTNTRRAKSAPLEKMPSHDEFLKLYLE